MWLTTPGALGAQPERGDVRARGTPTPTPALGCEQGWARGPPAAWVSLTARDAPNVLPSTEGLAFPFNVEGEENLPCRSYTRELF